MGRQKKVNRRDLKDMKAEKKNDKRDKTGGDKGKKDNGDNKKQDKDEKDKNKKKDKDTDKKEAEDQDNEDEKDNNKKKDKDTDKKDAEDEDMKDEKNKNKKKAKDTDGKDAKDEDKKTKKDNKTEDEEKKTEKQGGDGEEQRQDDDPDPESKEILDYGYLLGRELGSGSYSRVRLASKEGNSYAAKIIVKALTSPDYRYKFMPRELKILKEVNHKYITKVYDIIDLPEKVFIVMELASGGDLLEKVHKERRFSEHRSHYYFLQLSSALAYLHKNDIAHRDLKCENVLCVCPGVLKITDFSFARYCTNSKTGKMILSDTFCGSEAYAPPEILQGLYYLPKQDDIWSLGVILYVMLTGLLPFEEGGLHKQIRLQMTRCIRFPHKLPLTKYAKNLLRQMLEPVIHMRASMQTVARHPWLKAFPLSSEEPP